MRTTPLLASAALLLLGLASAALAWSDAIDREALINSAIQEAKAAAQTRKMVGKIETSPSGFLRAFKKAPESAIAQGEARLRFEETVKRAERKILEKERKATSQGDVQAKAQELARELMHTPGSVLTAQEIARIYESSECAETVPQAQNCELPIFQKHRSADGSCNNLATPLFGAAQTNLRRLLPTGYEDGVSVLRGYLQSTGTDLFTYGPFAPPNPSARVVSLGIVQDRPVESSSFTHILMQWGQFMDHDMTLVPEFEDEEGECADCHQVEAVCAPIQVPRDDRDIDVTRVDSVSCHPFRRSLPVCDSVIPEFVTPREQQNVITAFIDGSQVYGSNQVILDQFLRDSGDMAMLATSPPIVPNGKPSLPRTTSSSLAVGCPNNTQCFLAGDIRVNEQTGLITMHTIWMREHNRVAAIIRGFNPQFSDNKVFLTAREIVAAEIQKITYKDYLPILLGPNIYDLGNLIGPYEPIGYDQSVDPNIPNAFATAAYRFGHSQIQPFFDRLDTNYNPTPRGPLSLIDAFFNIPEFEQGGGVDPILRGLVSKPARSVDEFLSSILTNSLFASSDSPMGLDLAALNIQRGRDHGLPPYLVWKRWAERACGISSDFKNELTKVHLLQTYGGFESIDLWVGGLAEESVPGGLVGATFACIFAKAFSNLRHGDRFYYENNNPSTGYFTPEQTAEIENTSLSRVICDNADNIQNIQPDAFRVENRVPCADIPSVDLSVFGEPELPSLCYMRLAGNSGRLVTSISRLYPGIQFHVETRFSQDCIPFRCPETDGRSVRVLILSGCSVQPNQNLNIGPGRFLFTVFDESEISPTNGIYTSLNDCNQGSNVGLTFNCQKSSTSQGNNDETLLQTLENTVNAQEDISTDVEAGDGVVPAEDWQIFRDEEARLDNPTSSDNKDREQLVTLLQEVLGELKKGEAEEVTVEEDEELVSELAKALKDIQ